MGLYRLQSMIGSKVKAPAASLLHLALLHLSFLLTETLLKVESSFIVKIQLNHIIMAKVTIDLKVFNHDSERDVVGSEVLLQRAQTGSRDSDVDRKLRGDRVEPEVQLWSNNKEEVTD